MPEYGSRIYWEKRYATLEEAFDWMCDYDQLEPTLLPLLKDFESNSKKKDAKILIVGCGNANFSPDFVKRSGFQCKKIIHIDYCNVVVEQQKKKYPKMDFRVMDALDMDFEDNHFDFVIDKSLIDTTLCYEDGHKKTEKLFHELHRVLKPGGRLITISLHTEDEVKSYESPDEYEYEFLVKTCKLVNTRRYVQIFAFSLVFVLLNKYHQIYIGYVDKMMRLMSDAFIIHLLSLTSLQICQIKKRIY